MEKLSTDSGNGLNGLEYTNPFNPFHKSVDGNADDESIKLLNVSNVEILKDSCTTSVTQAK